MYRPIALALICVMLFTACGWMPDDATEPEPAGEAPDIDTPQAFVNALDAAMAHDGEVLHTTITATGGEAGEELEDLWTDELWIFAAEDSARRVFHPAPENSEELADKETFITNGEVTFNDYGSNEIDVSSGPPLQDCPLVETSSMVYVLAGLFCARYMPQADSITKVSAEVDANATFEGQPVAALVYTARSEVDANATPEPESPPPLIVSTFYADRETMLPLGWTVAFYATTDQLLGTLTGRYSNEFIDRDELAADFFSPVALLEPAPSVPLYWLGSRLDPGNGLPAIVPREITLSQSPTQQPSYQIDLTYGVPFGTQPWITEIHIQQWARDDWEAALDKELIASELWLYPCAESQSVDIEEGEATIYLTYEPEPNGPLVGGEGNCPDYEPDRFIGIVQIDEMVLLIDGLYLRTLGDDSDPYNSLDGVQTIIEGLQPL